MAEIHGSTLVFLHNAQDITAYLKDDLDLSAGSRELHDVTTYGDTAEGHMVSPIKKSHVFNIGGTWSPEIHAIIAPLDGETDATEARPEGTGSTKIKLTGNSTLTDYTVKSQVNGPATWSAKLTAQGAFVWGTQS